MQSGNVGIDFRMVSFAGGTPIVQSALRTEPVNEPVSYGESAAAFQLSEHEQHLPNETESSSGKLENRLTLFIYIYISMYIATVYIGITYEEAG